MGHENSRRGGEIDRFFEKFSIGRDGEGGMEQNNGRKIQVEKEVQL
jgi:hypothetical protein